MELDERTRGRLAATRFADVRLLPSVDSTNRLLAGLAAGGAPEGLVVVADHQTAGRGRLDRSWEAAPGDGLLVSVLLRPAGLAVERWHLVTAAAGLAARDACREVAGVDPGIKWPNDLVVGDAKLAGILAEATGEAVVVGMGLNVHDGPPGAAVVDREAGRRVDRGALLGEWLIGLDAYLGDWDGLAESFRSGCSTVGRDVLVRMQGGDEIEGRAESVDDGGRLMVRAADGHLHCVAAGDVTHLRGSVGG